MRSTTVVLLAALVSCSDGETGAGTGDDDDDQGVGGAGGAVGGAAGAATTGAMGGGGSGGDSSGGGGSGGSGGAGGGSGDPPECAKYDAKAKMCFPGASEDFYQECLDLFELCGGALPAVIECRIETPCDRLASCMGLGC